MKNTLLWITRSGMEPYAQAQQNAWIQALNAEGWSVQTQHYQPRTPWRSSSTCARLVWGFVPTQLDVWSARLFADQQMAVIHELPASVPSLPKLAQWCVPSESLRMHLIDSGVPQGSVELVQGYAPSRSAMTIPLREKLNIDKGAPLIYAGGPLVASTGNKLAIWSLSILQQLHPQACLVLHGEGAEQERLQRFAGSVCEPESVYFVAGDMSTHDLVAQADIVCLPQLEDGVPDALFTALAHGKPMIAAQQPSLGEWLRHDVNALLLPTDHAPTWTAAMDRLITDRQLNTRLSAGARATEIPSTRLTLPPSLSLSERPQLVRSAA